MLTDGVIYARRPTPCSYDAATLQNVHDSIGDFAGGLLLATAWSSSVEHQLGVQLGTDTARTRRRVPGRRLGRRQRVVAVARRPRRGGDRAGVGNQGNADRGTAFDRVAAFRDGFQNGPSQCVQSS